MQYLLASGKNKTLQPSLTVTGCSTAGAVTVASSAGYEAGDIVLATGLAGLTGGVNAIWQISITSGTVVQLKSIGSSAAPTFAGAWTSGGTLKHIGWTNTALTLDNTIFDSPDPDFTLVTTVDSLSASTGLRIHVLDTSDSFAADIKVGPMTYAFGPFTAQTSERVSSVRRHHFQGLRLGSSGNALRSVVMFEGVKGTPPAVGASAMFSQWVEA